MLEVVEPGLLTTVQDRGRRGWARYGVPPSGPMDPAAFLAANSLVGNAPEAAGLEVTLSGPVLYSSDDCLVAVCGAEMEWWAGSLAVPTWHAVFVRGGDIITFGARRSGARAYLAVAGGIDVPTFLGSRSTYLRGGFGGLEGRALLAGDILPVEPTRSRSLFGDAGRCQPRGGRPPYRESPSLRVILGPQDDYFTAEDIETFFHAEYRLTPDADRMGVRLQGPRLGHRDRSGIVSDGVVTGCVQVPPDGQPIVMMVDHQTTGGYPKIATVISEDLPLLAQCLPGDVVRFQVADLPSL